MILNNCNLCGRKPEIKVIGCAHYAECKCGITVCSNGAFDWRPEVAADMWNRANPEQDMSIQTAHINKIAAQLAKIKAVIFIVDGELCIAYPCALTDGLRSEIFYIQMDVRRYEQELTEFYKKRLEPGAIA